MQISKDPKTELFRSEINNVLVFLRQQSHPAHTEHSEQSPKKSCFISKCFLCNGDPKCVKACPTEAIRYVPWMDRSKEPTRGVPHGYLPQNSNDQCGVCHG